ncbi:hypothetical protein E4U36_003436 [Claviceps purpurea]|nr:hypothetical protein E4U36_003436 [Claviceps purpurea]
MATVWTFIFYAEVDREGSCRRIGTFGRMTPQVHAIECTSMSGRTCGVPVSIRQSNVGKDRVGGGILVNFLVLNTEDCPNIGYMIQSIENCMVELLAWNATLEHIEDSIDRRCANLTYERDKIKAKQRGIVCGTRVAASQEQTSRAALIEVFRLSKDFPSSLESDLAWDVTRFKSDSDYIVYLTEEHLREIDVALGEFKELGLDGDLVRRNNFQLPTLEGDLNHLQNEIHNGKGFDLIHGMEPPRRFTTKRLAMLPHFHCRTTLLQPRVKVSDIRYCGARAEECGQDQDRMTNTITSFGRAALLDGSSHPQSADLPKLTMFSPTRGVRRHGSHRKSNAAGDIHFLNI